MEQHLLVILPHPDDESFSAAGIMAQYRQKGIPVTHVCATLGEMGRNMGKPPFANRETLHTFRKKELEEACRVLGVDDLRLLGMRDKTLEFEDPDAFAERIKALIEDVNPSLVISFYPGHGIHPDHDAIGEAVSNAVSRIHKERRPDLYCRAILPNSRELLGEPDVVIDVRDVFDKKIAALKAHESQMPGLISEWEKKAEEHDPELVEWLGWEIFWVREFE